MEPDDVYPNDSSYFVPREPSGQAKARRQEKANTLEGLAVLKEVVKRLEKRIKFYESVDAMPNDVKTDPQKFMIMHNANQLTRDNLREEKEYIEILMDANER